MQAKRSILVRSNSHHGPASAGKRVRKSEPVNTRNVVFVRQAKQPRNHITRYAITRSFTRPTRVAHSQVFNSETRRWSCSCESFQFTTGRSGKNCKHIRVILAKLRQLRKRKAA